MFMLNDTPESFQPTPPARGATVVLSSMVNFTSRFQPTPPARGATVPGIATVMQLLFQSTPPARGATGAVHVRHRDLPISIHTPREGGDDGLLSPAVFEEEISTHAPREGGDSGLALPADSCVLFQPTPPARGATPVWGLPAIPGVISTHAPREGGDWTISGPTWPEL